MSGGEGGTPCFSELYYIGVFLKGPGSVNTVFHYCGNDSRSSQRSSDVIRVVPHACIVFQKAQSKHENRRSNSHRSGCIAYKTEGIVEMRVSVMVYGSQEINIRILRPGDKAG